MMSAIRERIEDPDLDGRMGVQRDDLLVSGERVAIVDQHANAHTAIGRTQQCVRQQSAGLVTPKNIVLKIQGSYAGIDHLRPRQEPVDANRKDAKSGVTIVLARRLCKLRTEAGFLRMRECRGRAPGKVLTRRERCAATDDRCEKHDEPKARTAANVAVGQGMRTGFAEGYQFRTD
jgi:hypothetical protein